MEQRICTQCDRALRASRFAKDRSKASGYKSLCKDCDRAKSRRYYAEHREAKAVRHRARRQEPDLPSPCPECSGPVPCGRGNRLRKYCSARCRSRAKAKRQRPKRRLTERNSSLVECVACAKRFRKRNDNIRRWPTHCCSNACKNFAKRSNLTCDLCWVSCLGCRATWSARNPRQTRCAICHPPDPPVVRAGPVCRIRKQRSRRFISCRCQHCSEPFLDWDGYHPATYRSCPACKPKRWKKDRERAERYGVAYEPISRRKLYERDGHHCGICGEQTDPTAAPSTPRYPTLDHVVPMANGGPHLWDNVQCACFECNWRKADGTDAEPKHPAGMGRGAPCNVLSTAHSHRVPQGKTFVRNWEGGQRTALARPGP